jgi:hypothetical protein
MHPDQVFRAEYLATTYHAAGFEIRFSSLETGQVLFEGRRFALITAQNPRSTPLDADQNLALNMIMQTVLQAKGWSFGNSYGHNSDLSWSEAGFIVWDVELPDILRVARDFEQNAILYSDGSRLALSWCFSGETDWFYPSYIQKEV